MTDHSVKAWVENGRLQVRVDLKTREIVRDELGRFAETGGEASQIQGRLLKPGGSPSEHRTSLDVGRYDTFKDFSDPGLNTPGGRRWPKAVKIANGLLEEHHGMEPQDFELKVVKVADVSPNQFDDDYINDSSRETARKLKLASGHRLGEDPYDLRDFVEGQRLEDWNPIAIKSDGGMIDGNHRHAAHVLNKEKEILAFVAVGPGTGKIVNMREAYNQITGK